MVNYLDGLKVMNLTSRYCGWVEDVESLANTVGLKDSVKQAFPALKIREVSKKLRGLKYCCLVSRLTVEQTRIIFEPVQGALDWSDDVDENGGGDSPIDREELGDVDDDGDDGDFLEELFKELSGELQEGIMDELEYGETIANNHDFDLSDLDNNDLREAKGTISQEPFYGRDPFMLKYITVLLVVDCYGIYTKSIKKWLNYYCKKNSGRAITGAMRDLQQSLDNNPELDGPAILLSPENIIKIQPMIANSLDRSVRELLTIEAKPDMKFLKMVFLHEIGHHMFPAPTKNLSEAMANWFAYRYLDYNERLLLQEKASYQKQPYQMYLGLLSLKHASRYSTIFSDVQLQWPLPASTEIVEGFETGSLNNLLRDDDFSDRTPWTRIIEWMRAGFEIFIMLNGYGIFKYRKKPYDIELHPAQILGYMLVREIMGKNKDVFLNYLSRHLDFLRSNSAGYRMTKKYQKEWLKELYKQDD